MELNTELYNRIQETAKVEVMHIGNKDYTTQKVYMVEDPIYKPERFDVNSLTGICSLIKTEIGKIKEKPIIVNVETHNRVSAYTTYDERFKRTLLYRAVAELPCQNSIGGYSNHEDFMIELRSKFVRTDDVGYLLNLLASVVDENKVKSTDNGLSQKVEVQQGITTIGETVVKPIVSLAPYRTFLEVDQPASEFLVRLKEGGKIGLFEADGGMWGLNSKANIAKWLREQLSDYLSNGSVVITE